MRSARRLQPASSPRARTSPNANGAGPRTWPVRSAPLLGPGAHRVGIERMNAGVALALVAEGLDIVDAQEPVEMARSIKSPARSRLHPSVAAYDGTRRGRAPRRRSHRASPRTSCGRCCISGDCSNGDYCETRLLNSGPADQSLVSRDLHSRDRNPMNSSRSTPMSSAATAITPTSREPFTSAPPTRLRSSASTTGPPHEQVHHNMAIIGPGVSFRDYSELAWDIPDRYHANRYYLSAHGCGMTGEYPYLYHRSRLRRGRLRRRDRAGDDTVRRELHRRARWQRRRQARTTTPGHRNRHRTAE